MKGVDIALGNGAVDDCALLDFRKQGFVSVDEILAAVAHALTGCD